MLDGFDNSIPSSYFAPINHGLDASAGSTDHTAQSHQKGQKNQELTPEEQKEVQKLKARDREVRAHEAAHLAAAGGLATSGATFGYQTGPDGIRYAVEGEVHIDVSPASTPEATVQKMEQVKRSALAPAHPSSTDQAVAAEASQREAQARMEQTKEKSTDAPDSDGESPNQKIASENQDAAVKENSKLSLYQEKLQPLADHFRKWI